MKGYFPTVANSVSQLRDRSDKVSVRLKSFSECQFCCFAGFTRLSQLFGLYRDDILLRKCAIMAVFKYGRTTADSAALMHIIQGAGSVTAGEQRRAGQ